MLARRLDIVARLAVRAVRLWSDYAGDLRPFWDGGDSKYCDDLKKLTYIEKCFGKFDILYKVSVFAAEITFTSNEKIYNEGIITIMIHEVNFVKKSQSIHNKISKNL